MRRSNDGASQFGKFDARCRPSFENCVELGATGFEEDGMKMCRGMVLTFDVAALATKSNLRQVRYFETARAYCGGRMDVASGAPSVIAAWYGQ